MNVTEDMSTRTVAAVVSVQSRRRWLLVAEIELARDHDDLDESHQLDPDVGRRHCFLRRVAWSGTVACGGRRRLQWPALRPPSTWTISPVTNGDASRNRTARTMSST